MIELLGQGLFLTMTGMAVVFAFLGLLVGATHALGRYAQSQVTAAMPLAAASLTEPETNSEVAVAIAAAVHRYRSAAQG